MSVLAHIQVRDNRYYRLWLSLIGWKSTDLSHFDQNTQTGAKIRNLFHVRDISVAVSEAKLYRRHDDEGFRICQY